MDLCDVKCIKDEDWMVLIKVNDIKRNTGKFIWLLETQIWYFIWFKPDPFSLHTLSGLC